MKSPPYAATALAVLLSLLLSACITTSQQEESLTADSIEEKEPATVSSIPFSAESFHDLLVAEFAVRRDQFDVALGYYVNQAHQTRDPGVINRATRLAQYLKADKAALDVAQLWAEVEPNNPEAHYTTATMLAKNKQPLKALEHMEKVLIAGANTNFTAIAASSHNMPALSQQLVASAIDDLISRHPNYGQLHVSQAIMLQSQNKLEQALTATRKGIKFDNTDIQAVIIETRLLQQMGKDDQAFTRLEAIQQQFPNNRRLRLQYARLLLKKDLPKARTQFEHLLVSTPNDPDLLMSLALINTEIKDYDLAKHYFNRALTTGTRSNEAHYYLAQIAERENKLSEAISHYEAIVKGDDYVAATNRITELYVQQGQTHDALKLLQQRRGLNPDLSLRFYILEAELLFNDHNYEQSHQTLSEALGLHPNQTNLLYMRSLVSEKRNDLVLMEQDLNSIIQQDANNATALNALGYVLANRAERLEEAFQLITRALAIKPDDPAILDSLGWVEYRRGHLDRANILLEKAYRLFPDSEVAAHLGEVLWRRDLPEKAQQVWQQALDKTPHHPVLQETIKRLMGNTADTQNPSPTP
ncbi:MAG: tetratricopeptide (TPR) repeat protein [Pseudohongiellaceae bacterium]|jgi:tetratricopeptide (TPR) repeat protein